MPIHTSFPIRRLTKDRFYTIDHSITGIAFQIQNEFGRLLHEKNYQAEIARRAESSELATVREFQVTALHQSYSKEYYLDLLVEAGVVIETKAVASLNNAHRAQVLNYLFLCDLQHATLLNFRSMNVEHEFVSTHLTLEKRRQYRIHDSGHTPDCREIHSLRSLVTDLLDDWGTHLDPLLYREAILHLTTPESPGIREINIRSGSIVVGTQPIPLLSTQVGLAVTAINIADGRMRTHLQRLLDHTELHGVAWVNLHQSDITLTYLKR